MNFFNICVNDMNFHTRSKSARCSRVLTLNRTRWKRDPVYKCEQTPDAPTIMWYSSWSSIGSLTTVLIEFIGILSVLSVKTKTYFKTNLDIRQRNQIYKCYKERSLSFHSNSVFHFMQNNYFVQKHQNGFNTTLTHPVLPPSRAPSHTLCYLWYQSTADPAPV